MGSRYGGMKQIDPIGPNGEFIIDYSCYDAIKAGFDRIVFVIKEENLELFRSSVGCRVEPYAKVEYAFQDINDIPAGLSVPEGRSKPWGTSHALLATRDIVDDCFATINADDFYGAEAFEEMAQMLKAASAKASPMPICFVAYRLANTLTENGTVSRGICELGDNGTLLSITERTKIRPSGADAEYQNEDGSWNYASLRNSSSWLSMSYGKKWQGVLFLGYLKNLGLAEAASGPIKKSDVYFCSNGFSNINQMFRINPQIIYNIGKMNVGLEYQYTGVQYGKYDEKGCLNERALAVKELHMVGNHRVNMMVKYNF